MAQNDEPGAGQVQIVRDTVSKIVEIPPEQVLRSDVGLNLYYAQWLRDLYVILDSLQIGRLPAMKLNQLQRGAQEALEFFQNVANTDRSSATVSPQRGNLISRSQQIYDEQFDRLSSCIAVFQAQAGGLESFKRAAADTQKVMEGAVTKANDALKELTSKLQQGTNELDKSIEIAKKAAEINALSSYAKYFKDEAQSHKKAGWAWLGGTGVLFSVTGFLAYWFWVHFGETLTTLTTAQNVQLAITKLVILSTVFTIAISSSRIYRSHRHNYVVNQHRKNALQTFQAFVNAPEADAQTKNAVLLEATKCIFSQQPTGYISSEQETQPSQILEIVRQLSPRS